MVLTRKLAAAAHQATQPIQQIKIPPRTLKQQDVVRQVEIAGIQIRHA